MIFVRPMGNNRLLFTCNVMMPGSKYLLTPTSCYLVNEGKVNLRMKPARGKYGKPGGGGKESGRGNVDAG